MELRPNGKGIIICPLMILLLPHVTMGFCRFYCLIEAGNELGFRLGASVPSSAFGSFRGGGRAFYNYMTKGPGFFAHIDWAMGIPSIWDWHGQKVFLKDMLDAADEDNGRCEISITLYGIDLGWPEIWKPLLLEVLEAIGPNRKSLRFIFLAGEWSYINRTPPAFDELKTDFFEARDIVASYGYTLGWQGEGKYFSRVPKELSSEVLSWGPRCRNAQISYNSDPVKGADETYRSASGWRSPNDVFLNAFTMWDDAANKPGTPPYYVYYEKFEAYFRAASELYASTNGQYPQSLTFNVMPITFDISVCPYMQWWSELCEKYNVRTSQSPPVQIKEPTNLQPPSPFPPYPTLIKWTTSVGNLMPFYVQAGGTFSGAIYAKDIHNNRAPSNREVEVYLIKQTLRSDSYWRPDHPLTRDEWANDKIFVGKAVLGADGWGLNLTFPAPTEPGRYVVIPRVPGTDTEMEGWADPIESILVAEKTHIVEVRSNVRIRLIFGPTGYGPPWQGVDSQRWVSPTELLKGTVSEGDWTFVAPSAITDSQGKTWIFLHWEDNSTNPMRTVFVDRDMILKAHYSEEGVKSKIEVYGYVRDDRNNPLTGASVNIISPVDQVTTTDSQGKYTVTLPINGPGDTIKITATYHGRSATVSSTVPNGASSMQINVTVPRTMANISCSVSSSTVTIGGSITVSGVISPTVGGTIVTLTYTKPDASLFTHTVATSPNGAYSDNYTPDQLGTYSVIASWPGNGDYREATSLPALFMVKKNPSSVSIILDSTSISPSDTLKISGALSPPLSDVQVMLSYRVKGGSWVPLRNLTTNSNGRFSYVWANTPSEGEYELRASWLGDDYYEGCACTVLFVVMRVVNPPVSDFSDTTEEPYSMTNPDLHEQSFTVTLPTPNFTVSADPKIVRLPKVSGYNTTVMIKVSSLSNYTMELSLKVSGIPKGIEARLSQETLMIQRLGANFTILVISIGESPPDQGNYSILIECNCGNVVASDLVNLIVVDRVLTLLEVNMTPTLIQYGDIVLINGSVSPLHQANILVTIVLKNGSEIDTAIFCTDETGKFSQSIDILLPPDEYVVRVSCKEDVFYSGSVLNLTLRVERTRIIITLGSNTTRTSSDEPVFFNGIVATTRGEPIRNMDLTILIAGETGSISVPAKTDENGTYTAVISGLSPGKYDVISRVEGNGYHEPARSVPVKIEVLHPASRTLNDMLYPAVSMAVIILALITS
ncbi:carboxypeptidase regulatory-like domain-containing protein, partial [Candidatus Bathyarchaeota archaeon]|nr:carboxypeptidase regulatory-like domain-containing protein [Candidatus Bathyarchaeota archaeon]